MYSYSLKVTENDEAVSFLIGSRQRRQKNYSKVCDELIGSHLKLVPYCCSRPGASANRFFLAYFRYRQKHQSMYLYESADYGSLQFFLNRDAGV